METSPLENRTRSAIEKAVQEPSESTVIWKYLDFAKFMSLLRNRRLHLAPTSEFWDRFEGDIGTVQKQMLIDRYGKERYERVSRLMSELRDHTYVSCWTENEFESDAMWRIYTGASYGVAIQTTYGRLKSVLPKDEPNLICTSGNVNYVDFKKEVLSLDAYNIPYFYKRKSFEHEREVRVLLQDVAQVRRLENGRHEEARNTSEPSKGIVLTKEELNHLIESVHLSPGAPIWFKDLVADICKDYGLDREPIPSSLDEEPS